MQVTMGRVFIKARLFRFINPSCSNERVADLMQTAWKAELPKMSGNIYADIIEDLGRKVTLATWAALKEEFADGLFSAKDYADVFGETIYDNCGLLMTRDDILEQLDNTKEPIMKKYYMDTLGYVWCERCFGEKCYLKHGAAAPKLMLNYKGQKCACCGDSSAVYDKVSYDIEDVWVRAWLYRTISHAANEQVADKMSEWYTALSGSWSKDTVKSSVLADLDRYASLGSWKAIAKAFLEDVKDPMSDKKFLLDSYMKTFAGRVWENSQYLSQSEINRRFNDMLNRPIETVIMERVNDSGYYEYQDQDWINVLVKNYPAYSKTQIEWMVKGARCTPLVPYTVRSVDGTELWYFSIEGTDTDKALQLVMKTLDGDDDVSSYEGPWVERVDSERVYVVTLVCA